MPITIRWNKHVELFKYLTRKPQQRPYSTTCRSWNSNPRKSNQKYIHKHGNATSSASLPTPITTTLSTTILERWLLITAVIPVDSTILKQPAITAKKSTFPTATKLIIANYD